MTKGIAKLLTLVFITALVIAAITNGTESKLEQQARNEYPQYAPFKCERTLNFVLFSVHKCRFKKMHYFVRQQHGVLIQDSSIAEYEKTYLSYFGVYKFWGPY